MKNKSFNLTPPEALKAIRVILKNVGYKQTKKVQSSEDYKTLIEIAGLA